MERLLAEPRFQMRLLRFHQHETALELQEIPRVLDQLLDLSCVELRQLARLLALNDAPLQKKLKASRGPLSAERVLEMMWGWRPALGNRPPTTVKAAEALLEAVSRQIEQAADPRTRAALKERRAQALRLHQGLRRLKRPSPLERTGFFLNVSAGVRVFEYLGDDRERRDQGGLVSLEKRPLPRSVSRFLSDYLTPIVGTSAGVVVGAKERHTGKRSIKPFWSIPIVGSMHGQAWHCFSTNPRRFGFSITGPANIPLQGFSHDPMLGKVFSFALPFGRSFSVGERFLSTGYTFRGGALGGALKLPGSNAGMVVGVTFGILSDYVNHLTGPIIAAASSLAEGVLDGLGLSGGSRPRHRG